MQTQATASPLAQPRAWRILVDGRPELALELAAEIVQCYQVDVVRRPACGLVMAVANDTVSDVAFCLGEVLVTECTVTVAGQLGYGIVVGEAPGLAQALAVLDAAWAADLPPIADWTGRLLAEEAALNRDRLREYGLLAPSRVKFETMEDYAV